MDQNQLEELYAQKGYYWGKEANHLAQKLTGYINPIGKKLIDLGAGEGRDSVYFARQGFDVTAMDLSQAGMRKAKRLANEWNVDIEVTIGNVNDFVLNDSIDVVYSIGTLQYIRPEMRKSQFHHFKSQTHEEGFHVLFTFVKHPEIEQAPNWGKEEFLYERDELQAYYHDWHFVHSEEIIFDCSSGDVPHRHAARILITQKS